MADEQLKSFAADIVKIYERSSYIVNYKEKGELERNKYLDLLANSFSKIEPEKCADYVNRLRDITQKQILVPVNLFYSVITNHIALAARQMRFLERDQYYKQAQDTLDFYYKLANILNDKVKTVVEKEVEYLDRLSKTLSLYDYKEYLKVYEIEREQFDEIYKQAAIRLKTSLKIWKTLRKTAKKIGELKTAYPKTQICLEVIASLLGLIVAFSVAKKSFALIKIFGKGLSGYELAYDIVDKTGDLIDKWYA